MSKLRIVSIVEGDGETEAVPLLVERWLAHRRFDSRFEVHRPAVKAPGCGALKRGEDPSRHLGVECYVRSALRSGAAAILVVLDADKECIDREERGGPKLGPWLLDRAQSVAPTVPVSVVVANRTFEAWFLASRERLRESKLVRPDVPLSQLTDPEQRAGSKKVMRYFLGRSYSERLDQPVLTQGISFSPGTRKRAPSLDKLCRDLERLTREARYRSRP